MCVYVRVCVRVYVFRERRGLGGGPVGLDVSGTCCRRLWGKDACVSALSTAMRKGCLCVCTHVRDMPRLLGMGPAASP
eukprot:1086557-Pelagomonas_calceolata.AAC.1